mmetsp:Transcript_18464/g.34255  ORF Transcript_18464/g.34255 Transcript_18464/m.34255 type:complete len:92 (-) Transcript_18464:30-305(-)
MMLGWALLLTPEEGLVGVPNAIPGENAWLGAAGEKYADTTPGAGAGGIEGGTVVGPNRGENAWREGGTEDAFDEEGGRTARITRRVGVRAA